MYIDSKFGMIFQGRYNPLRFRVEQKTGNRNGVTAHIHQTSASKFLFVDNTVGIIVKKRKRGFHDLQWPDSSFLYQFLGHYPLWVELVHKGLHYFEFG